MPVPTDEFLTRVQRIVMELEAELGIPAGEIHGCEISRSGDNCQVRLATLAGKGPLVFRDNEDDLIRTSLRAVFEVFILGRGG